jgi:5'-nucleotidase
MMDTRVQAANILWDAIDTVFLDMDGTLLDLHYDNHFWMSHVPKRYGERYGLSFEESHQRLMVKYKSMEGKLEWYCVDFWSQELGLDIEMLKQEISHLIAIHPEVEAFLTHLHARGKRVSLVTNAHHKSLHLKLQQTGLRPYFDAVICAHDFHLAKEQAGFWQRLQEVEPFDPGATLLIDDNLKVLREAQRYGIAYLLAIRKPDSKKPEVAVEDFEAVGSFRDIMV